MIDLAFNATTNNYRFNPLISDVPKLEFELASLPDIIYFSGIEVSGDHREVFYSRITEEDADISLLYPR